MSANERQLAAGRAWAATLPRPAVGRREQDARFDRAEELAELERERAL